LIGEATQQGQPGGVDGRDVPRRGQNAEGHGESLDNGAEPGFPLQRDPVRPGELVPGE
jgi:hypothetical protein